MTTNHVPLESWPTDSSLTTLGSSPQTGEAAIAANDRICFGPFQLPEKQLAAPSDSTVRTPPRRSARLSLSMIPMPLFSDEFAAASSTQREGTPDEDLIPDEPSVILASRILSACSNPSPPPSPPLLSQQESHDPFAEDLPLVDIFDPSYPQGALLGPQTGPLIPVDGLSHAAAAASPFVMHPSMPTSQQHTSQQLGQANVSQPDLINFDSFTTPTTGHGDLLPKSTPTHKQLTTIPLQLPLSVDDLLSMSPRPPSPTTVDTKESEASVTPPDNEPTPKTDEEMEVANSLVIEADPFLASTPLIEMDSPEPEPAPEPPRAEPSPLRRSTRPRKSRNSLPQTIVDVSPQSSFNEREFGEAEPSATEQDSEESQPTSLRKRKVKFQRVPEGQVQGSRTDAFASPRRLSQVARPHRELGSLSPMSAAVLTQLLPRPSGDSVSGSSSPQPPQPQSDDNSSAQMTAAPTTPPHQITAFVFPKVGQPDGTAPDVQRPKSPLRPFSPPKLGGSPARRVPMLQAVADGTYSVQKHFSAFSSNRPPQPGSPVFKRVALDDPTRSPARRVPMSEAVIVPPSPGKSMDKGKAALCPTSPVRASSVPPRERERGRSAESQPLLGRKARGMSVEPASKAPLLGRRPLFQKSSSSDDVFTNNLKTRNHLPYPFVQQQLAPSIPEAEESGPSAAHPTTCIPTSERSEGARPLASLSKPASVLRQPSAGTGSKIPRIGAKPYARPRAQTVGTTASKLPTPSKSRSTLKSQTLRIVPVGSASSGSNSSDEGRGPPQPRSQGTTSAPAQVPILKPPRVVALSSSVDAVLANGLKRKREPEGSSPKASTLNVQPVIVMRKVVPGMFNKGKDAAPNPSTRPGLPDALTEKTADGPPVKPAGPIKARSAVGWKRPQQQGDSRPAVPSSVEATEGAPSKEPSPEPISGPAAASSELRSEPPTVRELTPPPAPAVVPTGSPPDAPDTNVTTGLSTAVEPAELSTSQPHRRSTRSKRTSSQATDVFGSIAPTGSVRPLQPRRRGPLPSETGGPFAGMSALALKTLTSANTLRNQKQVVKIQREVIRKEGNRPESPTTRVRSSLEQQKEMRARQRKERAERRARRMGGSDTDGDEDMSVLSEGVSALDGESDVGDASFVAVERDADGVPLRHSRGPGDEEDYETPLRPVKRGRFDGVYGVKERGGERERDGPEKRVKWHRGLHTMVYLNDAPPKPTWNTKAVPSGKGCLTSGAKTLRLDTLGNVLDAEVPLGGLVRENIVVKKFVFDNDEVPEVEPSEPVVKSTRSSKSRKAKS